ncbi:hypothetical protein PMSD_06260 [Paenibacillus macquariensis subsp. defensor]|nr:hypothetical protein PMSD_06260 [Paenibacillus macquariensis subsp. defensor]
MQFVDVMWSLFIFTGIEKATINHDVPGTPLNLYYMPYTHSLLGAVFWSIVAFIAIRYLPILNDRNYKKALIVSGAVFSHWILDLIVHTADLPLWMDKFKVGFGLYENGLISFLLEAVILVVGFILYISGTSGRGMLGKYGVYLFIIVIILFGINSVWGISPSNSQVAAGFLLFCYIFFSIIISWLEKKRK